MSLAKSFLSVAALLLTIGVGPAVGQDRATRVANFDEGEDKPKGTAKLDDLPAGGVLIALEVSGLPSAKWVAIHVHETGKCDHAGGHQSAGGHFNPTARQHGYKVADGWHAGDLPNQFIAQDGVLRAEIFTSALSLGDGDNGIVGRALIIHANRDDYSTQPSGDAGARLACAVIE